MQKLHNILRAILTQRFVRYVLVGGTTVAIDFSLLVFLHEALDVHLLTATTIAYWTSIVFNFSVNRNWTFDARHGGVGRHIAFYLTLLLFNYLFTLGFIAGATQLGLHYTIAKLAATGLQVAWTYIAYKKAVFRNHDPET